MINSEKVQEYIDALPLRPFRLQLTSGRVIDIRQSDEVEAEKSTFSVFRMPEQDTDPRLLAYLEFSYLAIESIGPVEAYAVFEDAK